MSNVQRTDITIQGTQASWQIQAEGLINGLYTGLFTFRCFLTPTQVIAANRERREILGANHNGAEDIDSELAFCLTQLRQRILTAPPFWTTPAQTSGMPGDIPDIEIIFEVLNAAMDAEKMYQEQTAQRKRDAAERAKKAAERFLKQQASETSEEDENEAEGE